MRNRLWTAGLGLAALGLGLALILSGPKDPRANAGEAGAAPGDAGAWKELTGKDLDALVQHQLKSAEKDAKTKSTLSRNYRKVERAGHVIAMLGNAAALTGEGDAAKKGAALRDAGLALAKAAKARKFPEAQSAMEKIATFPASIEPAADAKPAKWADVLPLGVLMKEVSAIDSETKSGANKSGAEFSSASKDLVLRARVLACLAVAAKDENANADWKKFCDDLKSGALSLADDFGKKNSGKAKESHKAMQKSCNACHAVYRKDE